MCPTILREQQLSGNYERLKPWDKVGLGILALFFFCFACLVEKRSCYCQRRMTDAVCFFRGAWAVRTGADLFGVTEENGWHYNYPPLIAILMVPLADAPIGEARDGLLPYPVLIAVWFCLNLGFGLLAVHWLARALEETSSDTTVRDTPFGCRAWWCRRVTALLFCLPPFAHVLMRGQVQLILLLALAGALRGLASRQNIRAGMWLALAICVKVFPAFLLVYPLWRRDWRFLGGCALGLVIGLAIIPGLALGPQRMVDCYRRWVEVVLQPGLTHQGDSTRAKELTNMTGTGSQSLLVVMHNTMHPARDTRPAHADPWLRLTALVVTGALLIVTLRSARKHLARPGLESTANLLVVWGALILVMLFACPVSHMHYFSLCIPLVMGLWHLHPPRGKLFWGWTFLATAFIASHTLPHIPETSILRDFGMAMYVGLVLWLLAVAVLRLKRPMVLAADAPPRQLAA